KKNEKGQQKVTKGQQKVTPKKGKVDRKLHSSTKKPKGHIDSNHVTFYDGHTLLKYVTLVIECLN
ncbi:TPA: hypothetical protein ACHIJO_003617, partial [Proteus mirabilis]